MYLLDTNIISEIMKTHPSEKVMTWACHQAPSQLFISTITIAEISYGLSVLPEGHRRNNLEKAFNQTISEGFDHRILSFNEKSAYLYSKLMSHRKQIGKPMSILDGQIAAIASDNALVLVTRNTRDFSDCGLTVFDPFK